MAHQNDVMKIFEQYRVDHIVNVRAQADVGSAQMHALTQAGQLRAVDVEAFLPEQCLDLAKSPTAAPGAMNDYDGWLREAITIVGLSGALFFESARGQRGEPPERASIDRG